MEDIENKDIEELLQNEQIDKIISTIQYESATTRLSNLKYAIIIAISIILSPIIYTLIKKKKITNILLRLFNFNS